MREDAELRFEVQANHYNDRCEIWRKNQEVDSDNLNSGAAAILLDANVRFQWINKHTFTDKRRGLGRVPDPTHDSTDRGYYVAGTNIKMGDFVKVVTPGSPSYGQWMSIQGIPEPFFNGFAQIMVLFRMTGSPVGAA